MYSNQNWQGGGRGGGPSRGGGFNNNFGGGSGGGGGRQSGRGRGRGGRGGGGRSYGSNAPGGSHQQGNAEPPIYEICKFFVKSGQCQRGNNCRYLHNVVVVAFTIPAHTQPLKSIGVMSLPDGPKLLTGSTDSTVKVWNLASSVPTQDISIPTTGPVLHLDVVSDSTVMWSVNEPSKEVPEVTVGTVYSLNTTNMATIPIKRSEEMPYTHASGEVRAFCTALIEGVAYVVTGGGEGHIRTWRFDAAKAAFEPLGLLEGHLRAVTCVLLQDTFLWSGSIDRTLRVWNVASGECVGVLSSANNGPGHADAVSCLESIPVVPGANPGEPYVASASADGAVKIWRTNGEFLHSCQHNSFVTALKTFQDGLGGVQALVIGLLDGSIVLRSCLSMSILFTLDSSICHTKAVWSIASLGQSCFATGGEDGNVHVWKIEQPLQDGAPAQN